MLGDLHFRELSTRTCVDSMVKASTYTGDWSEATRTCVIPSDLVNPLYLHLPPFQFFHPLLRSPYPPLFHHSPVRPSAYRAQVDPIT